MILKLKHILIAIFWLISLISYSQKTKVTGRVIDSDTKEAVPFATLAFKGTKTATMSDIDGNYSIESYYVSDSLEVTFVGYKRQSKKIKIDKTQIINFSLSTSTITMDEVKIVPDKKAENPAHPIVRNIIKYKKINNREKLASYEYETYNKVEFDLNNLTEEFRSKKVFKPFEFIWDNIDSTENKVFLPVFMTESLSDYYFQKSPRIEQENIIATKVSGIENNSVSQFLGDMYQSVNIYDNNVIVFGKSFTSPISKLGFAFYRYYLTDSTFIDNKWCYQIVFKPKRKQELTFEGDFWVNDTTYAIKKIQATISESANINFIHGLKVEQDFAEVEPEVWMPTRDHLTVDFNIADKTMGFYGRKTTTYKDFIINKDRSEHFNDRSSDIMVAEDANDKDQAFWDKSRHINLTQNEKDVYIMVDSIKNIPQFRTIADLIALFVSGYKQVGNFEIGPYYTLYSFNPVEGNRIRLGGRTSNKFSTKVMIEGYGAYGFKDEKFKYGGGVLYKIKGKPRTMVYLGYKDDIEQLGQASGAFREDNVLSSLFRRNPASKLTGVTQWKTYIEREWFYGLSNKLIFTHRDLKPLGSLEYKRKINTNVIHDISHLSTNELSLYTRFAYKEKFVSGQFNRVSLGTKFPTLEASFSVGLPNSLVNGYEYNKLVLRLKDKIRLGPFGVIKTRLEAGKIWGTLPFPLLQLHQGNETFFYDETAFNTMNYFEFVSDEWMSAAVTYHLEGYIFNKIPLFRKLKWREVVSGKAVVGRYNQDNSKELILPDKTFLLTDPFFEGSFGIENIFKFIRIDALYRLSYLDHPDIVKFGIRGKFHFNF